MEGRGRLGVALVVALISVIGYFASRSYNPVTQQTQHVNLTSDQEIALGLKAAPQMEAQYGGEADDPKGRQRVEAVGGRIVARSPAHDTPYRFAYHLLKDPQTIITGFDRPNLTYYVVPAKNDAEKEARLVEILRSILAFWFRTDGVPFPTLFKTVKYLQRRVHPLATVLVAGLAVLAVHLALYPWPDIADLARHP